MPSTSNSTIADNLMKADDVLGFHDKIQNPAVGAPPTADRSLVLGATVLTYAAWEGYVESLAVETVDFLSASLAPAAVPDAAKAKIGGQPWAMAGDGWRQVWRNIVVEKAFGNGVDKFGLSEANTAGTESLFEYLGVDPFLSVSWQKMNAARVRTRLDDLYNDRCSIAHTANARAGYGLNDARTYFDFVQRLSEKVDASVRQQVEVLVGWAPWPA